MAFDLSQALRSQEGKALGPHPAFMARTPVTTYSPGKPREDALISQRESAMHMDVFGGRQAIDWVYDCIGLYSDPISTSPFVLQKPDGTKLVKEKTAGTPPDHEVGPVELYRLLEEPNPFQSYDELMSLLVTDLLLVGNAYWYKWRTVDNKPLAIYRLSPSHVKIVPSTFGPKRYEYQPPGVKEPMKIALDQIVHFKRPNPHSPYYGMGVIQGAGRSMDLELAVTDTIASYYENKADPSLIIQSDRRVPRDVFNKLRAQLRARASGSKNAGELMVLEAGLKASSLSANAHDAMFSDLAKMSRDRVLSKFRASPMLFGILDQSSGNNKVSDVRREFNADALRPFETKLQRQITRAVTAAWDVEFQIDHRITLPAEEAIKVAESVAKMPGVKIREVRRQYAQFGIEESTGDLAIDEEILNLPGEELDENGQGGFADQPLGSEAGRPPKVSNTKAIRGANGSTARPAGSRTRPSGKALDEISARLSLAALEQKALEYEARTTVGNVLPGEKRPDDTYAKFRQADIDNARNFIAEGLREATVALERDLLDHVEGKALKSSDLVGRVRKSAAWKKFQTTIEGVLEEGARRAASSSVMHSGLTPEEDVDYDSIVKSVIYRPEGVKAIVATLKERAIKRIKSARDGDAERGEYEAAVREVISEWAEGQANTVADTEATHAYNEATLTVAEMSGVEQVFVSDGDDHDEPCQTANGSIWTIAEARENRVEHPNCRRAFLPISGVG